MIERITEKEMMQRINHVKEQLILTQGEGDMRFQEFRKWVRNQISEWYDNNEDYKKEIEEEDERLHERFEAEGERTFTVSKGPKRMYIVVEYNDGKELFLDGDGQKQFMEELAEAEATRDEIFVEKLFGVGSDYHGIAEEVVEAETFEAERYKPTPKEIRFLVRNLRAVWIKYERGIYDEDEVLNKTERILYHTGVMQEEYGAEEFEAHQFKGLPQFVKYDTSETKCCGKDMEIWEENSGDGSGSLFYTYCPICHDYDFNDSPYGAESFEATKGIDTYTQPFEELRIKQSKAKVGILLASIVASGVWFVNKMKED